MLYYFYKITNNLNNKYYYGVHQTENIYDGYMGSGVYLRRAYNKYGIENFTKSILKYFSNSDDMYKYESEIVTEDLVRDPMCYNVKRGGIGGNSIKGVHRPEISKKLKGRKITWSNKISNTLKGRPANNKGSHQPEEAKKKIGNNSRDRKWVNNGFTCKMVKNYELDEYLNNGFNLGRIINKQLI